MKKDRSNPGSGDERRRAKADPIQVTINLVPRPASPARQQAWRNFWARLLTEDKRTAVEGDTPPDEGGDIRGSHQRDSQKEE
jgi:hypothetical protein